MKPEDFRFFNPRESGEAWQNRLPHWQQDGAVYFVTFHLGDSVPRSLLRRWERERAAWLYHHPEPWTSAQEREYHLRFTGAMDRWLDAGHGSCALKNSDCRTIVADALGFFEGERCRQISWVIMPNHVHALLVLIPGVVIKELLQSWKSFTSKKIAKLLGRAGRLWQKDYYDRLVRNGDHFERCIRYIRRNPEKAGLEKVNSRFLRRISPGR